MHGKMQESRLTEIIPLICSLANNQSQNPTPSHRRSAEFGVARWLGAAAGLTAMWWPEY